MLGDSRAYASVRAKEELVVYYIMRADIEELVRYVRVPSTQTRTSVRRRQPRRCWKLSFKLGLPRLLSVGCLVSTKRFHRTFCSFKRTAKKLPALPLHPGRGRAVIS